MKIKVITFLFLMLSLSLVISSYRAGAASHGGYDVSGGESGLSNPTGCTSGGGCHASSANANIVVVLELHDSTGTAVTSYKPGHNYTVRFTGTNNTSSNLPAFGFQVTATVGTTELVTPTNAGTFGSAPTGCTVAAPQANNFVLNVFEQTQALRPASGTGSNGTIYQDSITWTAPAAGTGSISLWAAVNAVDNNGTNDQGDLWNTQHTIITEDTTTTVVNTGISTLTSGSISAYPNPVNDVLTLQWSGAAAGSYALTVYSSTGQLISSEQTQFSGSATQINTAAWAPGIYLVSLRNADQTKVIRILKP